MNKEISDFIKKNKIASICCVDSNNMPYCFQCFFVFDELNHLLFFKSSENTHHSKILSKNPNIAGSILPEKINFLTLKGIQFTGALITENFPANIDPDFYYHKKLPMALAKSGHVWCIELEMIKMTDNSTVFGKKHTWQKNGLG